MVGVVETHGVDDVVCPLLAMSLYSFKKLEWCELVLPLVSMAPPGIQLLMELRPTLLRLLLVFLRMRFLFRDRDRDWDPSIRGRHRYIAHLVQQDPATAQMQLHLTVCWIL